ncbi:MAG: SDR family NAD(P)-dependent oxidoreductase [Clostridia bacterium]|nr:SDR family NAD(P)-dependent oxidoreductase [Clostridia bacterium]
MKALVTGASSGIGRDIARYLSTLGYDLVIVARRENLLEELKKDLKTKVEIEVVDVSQKENCVKLFEKHKDIDLLVNNAGFGLFGEFTDIDLDKEISLIDTNIKAIHVLTKLYIQEMKKRNSGNILNVASIAGFMTGPLMASYYASKNYVVELSSAINKELKKAKSNVRISILCPGPVDTNFNNVAGVKFSIKALSSEYVAKYAIDQTLKGKEIIIPGLGIKILYALNKISPRCISTEIAYHTQKSKKK